MFIIIPLFYLSLGTTAGMLVWKMVSLRGVKLSLIPGEGVEKEFHSKLYEGINQAWHMVRTKYLAHAYALLLKLFYTVAHEILHFFLIVGQKLRTHHGKWYDMVKGKEVLKKKGSVSFFLRDVAEYKKSIQTK